LIPRTGKLPENTQNIATALGSSVPDIDFQIFAEEVSSFEVDYQNKEVPSLRKAARKRVSKGFVTQRPSAFPVPNSLS
jgi:hypothetical protein